MMATKAAVALAVGVAGAAAGCPVQLPSHQPNGLPGGCLVYDKLESLPNGTWNLTDGSAYHVPYFVTAPCGVLQGQRALCGPATAAYSGKAAPAVQVSTHSGKNSCLVLGDPATMTATQLPADDGHGGVSLVMTGGDDYSCIAGQTNMGRGRVVRYNMVCDPAAPANAGPSSVMATPAGCDYVVTWQTPLACPVAAGAGVGCGGAPARTPTPTPAQARYQDTDFIALIHFNMGTYAHNGDPCCDASNWDVKASYATGMTSDPATFQPGKLNTTQWMESITGLGANIAILTAKHGCGFTLWPTNASLPDGSAYGYSVGSKTAPGVFPRDVLREFVDSANAAGVGYGFYYSIMKSFYLCHSFSGTNSCGKQVLKGQHNFTDAEYAAIVRAHVTELWTEYGNLTEIWVDSGLGGFADLMVKLQPQAVGTPANPTSWCGTESGHPSRDAGPGPVWSTGGGYHGDPDSPEYIPKFCDPQLFQEHVWFWEPGLEVRTLAMMIPIYHDIVGRGMVMELAFSIDRDGLVQDTHAVVYKQLGAWARSCYGAPVAETTVATPGSGSAGAGWTYRLTVPAGTVFDRLQLREDTVSGQRIRNYTVAVDGAAVATGEAVGTKRILLLASNRTAAPNGTSVVLTVHQAIAPPVLRQFAVFSPCPTH